MLQIKKVRYKRLYTLAERNKALREYEVSGQITCTCVICGNGINTEPNAEKAYCDHCNVIVKVNNPLTDKGVRL